MQTLTQTTPIRRITSSTPAPLPLTPPFPYFGGKRRVASEVWRRFGRVGNYVEPFAGALAVLLGRADAGGREVVNDLDCFVANFWRATKHDPEQVAHFADDMISEADMLARHHWLGRNDEFKLRMKTDPEYFDARVAGWWAYGKCNWIGSGFAEMSERKRKLPRDDKTGIYSRGGTDWLPSHSPCGLHAHLDGSPMLARVNKLAERLRNVTVANGSWERVLSPSYTERKAKITGVFLDPPYTQTLRDKTYEHETDCAAEVRAWAIEHGDSPAFRIALCGYVAEHDALMPESWSRFAWKANGGFGNQSDGRGRANAKQECVWFSPHCLEG